MLKIALFGTSADPPTAAHQHILTWLSHQFDWVAVWASDNPFKTHQTPLLHRAAMLQLLIDDIDPPRDNIQLQQALSHPRAIATVEQARQQWSKAELTLVIGSDLVGQLPRWYRVEELVQQVKLLVVPRPGYMLKPSELAQLRRMGAHVAIAHHRGLQISSSAYRQQKDATLLTPPVHAYIHRENLYECQDEVSKSLVMPSPNRP